MRSTTERDRDGSSDSRWVSDASWQVAGLFQSCPKQKEKSSGADNQHAAILQAAVEEDNYDAMQCVCDIAGVNLNAAIAHVEQLTPIWHNQHQPAREAASVTVMTASRRMGHHPPTPVL